MLGCKGLSCMDLSTSRADATTGIHDAIEVFKHIFVKMHIIYDLWLAVTDEKFQTCSLAKMFGNLCHLAWKLPFCRVSLSRWKFYQWLISFKLLSFWMEKGQISIVEKRFVLSLNSQKLSFFKRQIHNEASAVYFLNMHCLLRAFSLFLTNLMGDQLWRTSFLDKS